MQNFLTQAITEADAVSFYHVYCQMFYGEISLEEEDIKGPNS